MATKKKPAKKIAKKAIKKKPRKSKNADRVIRTRELTKKQGEKIFGPGNAVIDSQAVYVELAKRYLFTMLGGQAPAYEPHEVLEQAINYFIYTQKNPLIEEKVFGSGYKTTVKHIRAMTVKGFCVYACIHYDTWNAYKKDKRYSDIVKLVEQIIFMQKFEGAAVDLLNANFIARELGLAEKVSPVDNEGNTITAWNYIIPQQPKNSDNNGKEDD
jgi:hypothetical protein